jgi:uncharacterized phage infection (PIP) family protein YhgE
MNGRVEEIAAAIEQIASGSQQVQADMAEVAAVAEQSSASTQQVSASTQQTSASTQQIAASAQELARHGGAPRAPRRPVPARVAGTFHARATTAARSGRPSSAAQPSWASSAR